MPFLNRPTRPEDATPEPEPEPEEDGCFLSLEENQQNSLHKDHTNMLEKRQTYISGKNGV